MITTYNFEHPSNVYLPTLLSCKATNIISSTQSVKVYCESISTNFVKFIIFTEEYPKAQRSKDLSDGRCTFCNDV